MSRLAAAPASDRLGPWARAAFVCALLPLAWALADPVFRLGLPAAWDEVSLQGLLEGALQGQGLPAGPFRGGLVLRALAALLRCGAPPGWLHVLAVLAYGAEAALLWRLGRRLGGEAAGFGAVAAHGLSRFTWLRLSSTLGFSVLPLACLLSLAAAQELRRARWALPAGLGLGALLLEHESGLAVLPALVWVLVLRRQRGEGRVAAAFAVGLLAGAALQIAAAEPGALAAYGAVRAAALRQGGPGWLDTLGEQLRAFAGWGPRALRFHGPGPALGLPFLLLLPLGLRRLGAAWSLALLGGLLLLAAPMQDEVTVHRAAAAWAPLCLAAGLGLERLLGGRSWRPARLAPACAAILLLAAFADRQAHAAAWTAREHDQYEYAWRLERAARRTQGEPVASALNFRSMGAFRLRHRPEAGPAALPDWCLLSGEQVGSRPPAAWGAWHPIQMAPGSGTLWLLRPRAPERARWRDRAVQIDAWLRVWDGQPWGAQQDQIEALLRGSAVTDPFLRSLLLDRALWAAKDVGWPPALLDLAARQPDLNPRQCLGLALALERSDPRRALGLARRALRLDPSRLGARRYADELAARLGG